MSRLMSYIVGAHQKYYENVQTPNQRQRWVKFLKMGWHEKSKVRKSQGENLCQEKPGKVREFYWQSQNDFK